MREVLAALRRRLLLTGWAAVQLAVAVPAALLFALTVAALPLTLIWVGVGVLLGAVPATRSLTGFQRRLTARVLGVPVRAPYLRPCNGLLARVLGWAADPASWRDLLWLGFALGPGAVLSGIAVWSLLGIGFYLIFPWLWAVTPDHMYGLSYGFFSMDTQAEAFRVWAFAALAAAIWWWWTPRLVQARCHLDRLLLAPSEARRLEARVVGLTRSRADMVDLSAAELRRIERDLHDGAQARLVALGLHLGLAYELIQRDPEQARELLLEARATSTAALADLRDLVRGIRPSVLADRGLEGALQALALDLPLPVDVQVEVPRRPPAPLESAVYFAVMECLTNVVKHADAERAAVHLSVRDGLIRVRVADDGRGGADPAGGTGLAGVARRLAAFDGTMAVSSPPKGPTVISMEIPCVLSSPKIWPSSGTV